MRGDKRRLFNRLDELCRRVVFLRDADEFGAFCQACRGRRNLEWAHVFTRGNKLIRWDTLNSLVMCSTCHAEWGHREPEEFRRFIERRLAPRDWRQLDRLGHSAAPITWSVLHRLEDKLLKEEAGLLADRR